MAGKHYANGRVVHDDKVFEHGDELTGLDKDDLDALVESGAAVEEKPEPTPDSSVIEGNPQIPEPVETPAAKPAVAESKTGATESKTSK